MKRKIVALIATLSAASAVVGCSGETPQSSQETPDGPVSLRMTLWSSNEGHLKMIQGMADAFVAENPDLVSDVEVNPTAAGGNYLTTLTSQLGADDAPDLGWLAGADLPEFADAGALVDLTPTLEATEGYDLDSFIDAGMSLVSRDDAIYGAPFSTTPMAVFYNADLFADLGLETPDQLLADGEWTWDALAETAATVRSQLDIPGYTIQAFATNNSWNTLSAVWNGFGAAPWNEAGDTCEFTSPEMVEALTFLHDMGYEGRGFAVLGEKPDFASGGVAMNTHFVSAATALQDAAFEWGVVPMPEGPAGSVTNIGQSSIVAFSGGDHPEIAAQFVAHLTNPENSQEWAQFFSPIRQPILEGGALAELNTALTPEQIESTIVDAIETGVIEPSHPRMGELRDVVRVAFDQEFWVDDADIEAFTERVCADIDPLLAG